MMFTANPPRAVSLYFTDKGAPGATIARRGTPRRHSCSVRITVMRWAESTGW